MAAQKENLLPFADRSTLRQHVHTRRPVFLQAEFSAPQSHQTLKAMKLQQRWQELKERELTAKKHNRQLLQQFDEAQDRLREMLTLNAAMKTIRKEYELYLEENSPRWEQQLKEQTQAAHRRRMGECLRSCLKHTDGISQSSPHQHTLSQGITEKTHNLTASQNHNNQNNFSDYNRDDSLHLPFMPSPWLSHPQSQTSRLPIRAPYQPQPSSHASLSVPPPPFFVQPPPFPLPHLASTFAPDWGSLLPHHLWPPTAAVAGKPLVSGALYSPLHMEEPPPERPEALVVREGAGTSSSSRSQRGESGGSSRSHLSQELDTKPVRLSSSHAESSESSRESDQPTQEGKKKKKRRDKREQSQSSSSGREAPGSQGSSGTSGGAIIFAPATVGQSPESNASSKRSSNTKSKKSGALAVVSPKLEMGMKEGSERRANNLGNNKEESQSTGEEMESLKEESRSEKSGNPESGSQSGGESGSVSVKVEDSSGDETERDESGGSGRKSVAEKVEEEEETERELGDGDRENDVKKENSKMNEEHGERDEEDNEASERKDSTEDEEGTRAEDEMEEQESVEGEEMSNKGDMKMRKQDTEEEDKYGSEGGEDETDADGESDEEERGESGEEKEPSSDEAEEPKQEGDSEDSIIAPQVNRPKKIYIIPEATEDEKEEEEEEEEEEEGSETGSSDDDLNGSSDEDIENLLAPQDQSQKKEEKEKSASQKPKAPCDAVETFQVEQCSSTKEDPSDSDEFDHFYD